MKPQQKVEGRRKSVSAFIYGTLFVDRKWRLLKLWMMLDEVYAIVNLTAHIGKVYAKRLGLT